MAVQLPSTPTLGSVPAQQPANVTLTYTTTGGIMRTSTSSTSSNNTYLLPTSPLKGRRAASDNYKPKILRTCGSRPACLVNASVTYCGDNQIYAFGGFDQYTDEGTTSAEAGLSSLILIKSLSLQSCLATRS